MAQQACARFRRRAAARAHGSRRAPAAFERRVIQTAQHQHLAARQQRAVELERRILGRGADQRDGAVLDIRAGTVLLRAVEAMDLVDEEQRALAVAAARRAASNAFLRSATPENTADSCSNCELDRARRAGARSWSCRCRAVPTGSSRQAAAPPPCGRAVLRTEQMILAHDLAKRGTQPVGQRRRRQASAKDAAHRGFGLSRGIGWWTSCASRREADAPTRRRRRASCTLGHVLDRRCPLIASDIRPAERIAPRGSGLHLETMTPPAPSTMPSSSASAGDMLATRRPAADGGRRAGGLAARLGRRHKRIVTCASLPAADALDRDGARRRRGGDAEAQRCSSSRAAIDSDDDVALRRPPCRAGPAGIDVGDQHAARPGETESPRRARRSPLPRRRPARAARCRRLTPSHDARHHVGRNGEADADEPPDREKMARVDADQPAVHGRPARRRNCRD